MKCIDILQIEDGEMAYTPMWLTLSMLKFKT